MKHGSHNPMMNRLSKLTVKQLDQLKTELELEAGQGRGYPLAEYQATNNLYRVKQARNKIAFNYTKEYRCACGTSVTETQYLHIGLCLKCFMG